MHKIIQNRLLTRLVPAFRPQVDQPVSSFPSNPELVKQIIASKELGGINEELAFMLTVIVDRYLARPDRQFLPYVEAIRLHALPMLRKMALKFEEARSDNPNEYYRQMVRGVASQTSAREKYRICLAIHGPSDRPWTCDRCTPGRRQIVISRKQQELLDDPMTA